MPVPKSGDRVRYNVCRTDQQKLDIIEEVDQATRFGNRGEQAAVLRRHGITTAHLAIWKRVLRAKGILPDRLWTKRERIQ